MAASVQGQRRHLRRLTVLVGAVVAVAAVAAFAAAVATNATLRDYLRVRWMARRMQSDDPEVVLKAGHEIEDRFGVDAIPALLDAMDSAGSARTAYPMLPDGRGDALLSAVIFGTMNRIVHDHLSEQHAVGSFGLPDWLSEPHRDPLEERNQYLEFYAQHSECEVRCKEPPPD